MAVLPKQNRHYYIEYLLVTFNKLQRDYLIT